MNPQLPAGSHLPAGRDRAGRPTARGVLVMWSSPTPWRGRLQRHRAQLHILEKSTFGEARRIAGGDDDVVQDPNVDKR